MNSVIRKMNSLLFAAMFVMISVPVRAMEEMQQFIDLEIPLYFSGEPIRRTRPGEERRAASQRLSVVVRVPLRGNNIAGDDIAAAIAKELKIPDQDVTVLYGSSVFDYTIKVDVLDESGLSALISQKVPVVRGKKPSGR
jgi:hypothetical protein